jgi:hypothetical protein
MRRTGQLQGLRLMTLEEVYGRSYRGKLGQLEAADVLGVRESAPFLWRSCVHIELRCGQ